MMVLKAIFNVGDTVNFYDVFKMSAKFVGQI